MSEVRSVHDSHYRHEPRFYLDYRMDVNVEEWRALAPNERVRRNFLYSDEVRRALFRRVCINHPDWSERQHCLMFFKLCFAGEKFETIREANVARNYLSADELREVRETPLPASYQEPNAQKYLLTEA